MTIEDLIQLLNNRLREFKLSRSYATMSGDLERVVAADKEIVGLEDTLYKLSLLVDTTKSAAVKEATLAEVMVDGSVAVLGEYDITSYATDPLHEQKILNILSNMGVMDTAEKIDDYIHRKYSSSPVTGEMVVSAALSYMVDTRLMMAIMEQDSSFGTAGVAVRTLNPGNVGNDDDGNIRTHASWQEGVTAVAEWLSKHRGSTTVPETVAEPVVTPIGEEQATSTPSVILPTATTTVSTTTSTTTTATTIPVISTPTEEPVSTITPTSTTTPSITSTTTPSITSTTTPSITSTTTPSTTTITTDPTPSTSPDASINPPQTETTS